jgi:hypothetical protein
MAPAQLLVLRQLQQLSHQLHQVRPHLWPLLRVTVQQVSRSLLEALVAEQLRITSIQ